MTDEQRRYLVDRLEAAARQQPEIKVLRDLLLDLGGVEFVPPPKPDPDVADLLDRGYLAKSPVAVVDMEASRCHENVADLWLDKTHRLTGIGTGYALSADGLWRQHSWGVRHEEILESTAERLQYFGKVLRGVDADAFATANQEDPEERRWRGLPEVWFRLEKDKDGYPPKDWEGLKCERTGVLDTYRIQSVPFFANGVAYEDEVQASASDEGYLAFKAVSKRGGYSTIRLWIGEDEDVEALRHYFSSRKCLIEFAGNFARRLVAVGIPDEGFEQLHAYILSEQEIGRWGVQDGYLAVE